MARLLGLAVVAMTAVFAASAAGDHTTSFTFVDIDGNVWVGGELLGGVVVLFFTGTWCEPCRIAEDGLQDSFLEHGRDATFLGVFLPPANNASSLESYRQSYGTPWPIGPDQDDMQNRFGVATLPVIFVLRYNGGVGLRWEPDAGGLTAARVRDAVNLALEAFIGEVPVVIPPTDMPWWPPLAVSAAASTVLLTLLGRTARKGGPG